MAGVDAVADKTGDIQVTADEAAEQVGAHPLTAAAWCCSCVYAPSSLLL